MGMKFVKKKKMQVNDKDKHESKDKYNDIKG